MNSKFEKHLTEYNNAGALLGIGNELHEGFLNYISSLNPIQRISALNKILKSQPLLNKGSRSYFEKFFSQLPQSIIEKLGKGQLRLGDAMIYAVKPISDKLIRIFMSEDKEEPGICNVSEAKLAKDRVHVVSGIVILAGVGQSPSDIKFKRIAHIPAVANGEYSIRINGTPVLPQCQPLRYYAKERKGYVELGNPFLIIEEQLIEFDIQLGTIEGITPETHLWVGLSGTSTFENQKAKQETS